MFMSNHFIVGLYKVYQIIDYHIKDPITLKIKIGESFREVKCRYYLNPIGTIVFHEREKVIQSKTKQTYPMWVSKSVLQVVQVKSSVKTLEMNQETQFKNPRSSNNISDTRTEFL